MNVYAIHGRFGAYVQLGETPEKGVKEKPKRSSLTGALTESTVTLEEALKLLELPRELGTHPESGQPVVAGLGRFGPYVKHGDDYRSLEATDDLFTVDLERALALLAAPKRSGAPGGEARHPDDRGARRRRRAAGARRPLRPVRHRRRDERVGPERAPIPRRCRSTRRARCSKRAAARRRRARRGRRAPRRPPRARPPSRRAAGR